MKNTRLLILILCTLMIAVVTKHSTSFASNITQIPSLQVTVETDKSSYRLHENMTISGTLLFNDTPVYEEGLVGLQVNDPVVVAFLRTVSVGNYSLTPEVETLDAQLCDLAGNAKVSISRGQNAYFKVTVRNNHELLPRTVLVSAAVFDAWNRPLPIPGSAYFSINPNATTSVILGPLTISSWAITGQASIHANAFTGWPSSNGVPYSPEKIAYFEIAGLEYMEEDDPPNQGGSQADPGEYQLNFKLSPEYRTGNYSIYAGANYRNWKANANTQFTIEAGPYPPEAHFEYIPRPESWVGCNMTFEGVSAAMGYWDYIKKYRWDFGDGSPIEEKTTSKAYHVFSSANTYLVTLNVTDNEGLWNTTSKQITVVAEKNEIGITDLQCLSEIYSDWQVNITVTVKNYGGPNPKSFDIHVYYNTTLLQTRTITNMQPWPNGVTTQVFTWNTTGLVPYVTYILQVEVTILPNENNTANNIKTVDINKVKMLGDITGDKKIDIYDVVSVANVYGAKLGDPTWNVQIDLKRDDKIDIYDVVIVTARYYQVYP